MGLFESIKNIMSIPDDEYDDEMEETEEQPASKKKAAEESSYTRRETSPRLVKSKSGAAAPTSQMQVVLVKPDRFEDVTSIADHLNEKKTVVLNLEAANRDIARRIVDFMSGAAYANHGNIRQVANSTFIIVPNGVDMMGELMLDEFTDDKIYF